MVGFHMLNNKIIGFSAVQLVFYVIKPRIGKSGVNRVHNGNFFVNY